MSFQVLLNPTFFHAAAGAHTPTLPVWGMILRIRFENSDFSRQFAGSERKSGKLKHRPDTFHYRGCEEESAERGGARLY